MYIADFETTTELPITRVYLWAIKDGDNGDIKVGFDIESFMITVKMLSVVEKIKVGFCNLKFDCQFIINYCLENNIEFSTLESRTKIYKLSVYNVDFICLFNLTGASSVSDMSLSFLGEDLKYKLESYSRPFNHIATDEEIEYIKNDVNVPYECLKVFYERINNINKILGEPVNDITKFLTLSGISYEILKNYSNLENFTRRLTLSQDIEIRKAYRGGLVYFRDNFKHNNLLYIDCNSMYPYIYGNMKMPSGVMREIDPLSLKTNLFNNGKFRIYDIEIKFKLKNGKIPYIYEGSNCDMLSDSFGQYFRMSFCNYDLEIVLENYNCEFNIIRCYEWDEIDTPFKDFVNLLYNMRLEYKKQNSPMERICKIILNSCYGKLAKNPKTDKVTYLRHPVTGYYREFEEVIQPKIIQFLHIAVSITAQARRHLMTTAKRLGYQNVLYMDTDSIIFKDIKGDFKDSKELGGFKIEYRVKEFKALARKRYVFKDNEGKYKTTLSGFGGKARQQLLSLLYEEGIDSFKKGLKLSVLQVKRVLGGTVLKDTLKEIK